MTESPGLDRVLTQQIVERRATHLDLAGRACDVAGVTRERLDEQAALGVVARLLERARTLVLRLRQFEVLGSKVSVTRQDHASLHAVLQLAHVAWPGVGLDGA